MKKSEQLQEQAKGNMKYIIKNKNTGEDLYICTLDKGYSLKSLRDALKQHLAARVAKPGEGADLEKKHYSSAALIFG